MSKHVESFFKDLAGGMSRRTAFRRLFAAMAGTAAAVLTGRGIGRAAVQTCDEWCESQTQSDQPYIQQCKAFSRQCPPGSCAINYLCSSGGQVNDCRGDGSTPDALHPNSNWICVQVF